MKKIYVYDAKTGEYLFSENAEKSPLEKDVYLLPANATFLAPPDSGKNQAAVFVGSSWKLVPDYRATKVFSRETGSEIKLEIGSELSGSVTTKPKPSLYHFWGVDDWQLNTEAKKQSLLNELPIIRYQAESTGITLGNGVNVQTDRDSQAMLMAAYALLKDGFQQTIDYKTASGFVQLDLQAITAIAQSVSQHVQECFSKEKFLIEKINAMTEAQLAVCNVHELWEQPLP